MENLLHVTNDLKSFVRASYKVTEDDIRRDVKIIYEWWAKQQHLPMIKDDDYVDRILMRNKFRIEQTKKKLDAYFTLKGLHSDFFISKDLKINLKTIKSLAKCTYLFPITTPTDSGERILVYGVPDPEASDDFVFADVFSYLFLTMEILNQYDYCPSLRIVCDMSNLKFQYYTKFDPVVLVRCMKIWREGYSCRLAGIEYVNAPNFIDLMITMVKSVVKEAKLRVHSSLEDLYKVVPRKILPREFGGAADGMESLQDAWIDELTKHKDFIAERISLVSNEKLRIGESQYNDLFGTDGTFKKLNLD